MPVPGIYVMIFIIIADFFEEVWSIQIARSRTIRSYETI